MQYLPARRPTVFVAVGVLCALAQLGLLALFTEFTSLAAWSNAVAFLISGQLNFVLSSFLTWRDRDTGTPRNVTWRVLRFNTLMLVAAGANQVLYLGFERGMHYLAAGAFAIVVTSVAKYLVADRWVFPRHHGPSPRNVDIALGGVE